MPEMLRLTKHNL